MTGVSAVIPLSTIGQKEGHMIQRVAMLILYVRPVVITPSLVTWVQMAAYIGTRVPREVSLRTESILVVEVTVAAEVGVVEMVADESVE